MKQLLLILSLIFLNASTSFAYPSQTFHEYRSFIRNLFTDIVERDAGKDLTGAWEFIKTSDQITLWKGSVSHTPWKSLKATTQIKASVETVAQLLNDVTQIPIVDKMVADCIIVENLTEDKKNSIRHAQAKPVFPTAPRDFVLITAVKEQQDGSILIASRSVEHPDLPVQKGFVRANTFISGYILRPLGEHRCEITLICHIDLRGYIPAAAINHLGTSAPIQLVRNIRTLGESLEGAY